MKTTGTTVMTSLVGLLLAGPAEAGVQARAEAFAHTNGVMSEAIVAAKTEGEVPLFYVARNRLGVSYNGEVQSVFNQWVGAGDVYGFTPIAGALLKGDDLIPRAGLMYVKKWDFSSDQDSDAHELKLNTAFVSTMSSDPQLELRTTTGYVQPLERFDAALRVDAENFLRYGNGNLSGLAIAHVGLKKDWLVVGGAAEMDYGAGVAVRPGAFARAEF